MATIQSYKSPSAYLSTYQYHNPVKQINLSISHTEPNIYETIAKMKRTYNESDMKNITIRKPLCIQTKDFGDYSIKALSPKEQKAINVLGAWNKNSLRPTMNKTLYNSSSNSGNNAISLPKIKSSSYNSVSPENDKRTPSYTQTHRQGYTQGQGNGHHKNTNRNRNKNNYSNQIEEDIASRMRHNLKLFREIYDDHTIEGKNESKTLDNELKKMTQAIEDELAIEKKANKTHKSITIDTNTSPSNMNLNYKPLKVLYPNPLPFDDEEDDRVKIMPNGFKKRHKYSNENESPSNSKNNNNDSNRRTMNHFLTMNTSPTEMFIANRYRYNNTNDNTIINRKKRSQHNTIETEPLGIICEEDEQSELIKTHSTIFGRQSTLTNHNYKGNQKYKANIPQMTNGFNDMEHIYRLRNHFESIRPSNPIRRVEKT